MAKQHMSSQPPPYEEATSKGKGRAPDEKSRGEDEFYSSSSDDQSRSVIQKGQSAQSAVDAFLKAYGRPANGPVPNVPQLAYPVVIPQRRPGDKERGFVKAYAPVLQQYGIDQDTWLDFLKLFNKAITHNKWIVAIQIAAMGAGFDPSGIAMGVSVAVQFIAGAVAQAESKWRTNSFLDRVNNEFFRPRGLYCLLMSYNPVTWQKQAKPGEAEAVSNSMRDTSSSGFRDKAKKNFRNPVAATAEGEENLPEATAELVYLDKENHVTGKSGSPQKKKMGDRLNDYFDRRAQAKYAKESNNDVLSNPNPGTFSNRYLDPNSKANQGGLLGLLSGGLLTRDPAKMQAQMKEQYASQEKMIRDQQAQMNGMMQQQYASMGMSQEQQQNYMKQYQDAYDMQLNMMKQQSEMVEKGQFNRRITRNILYLMVVNMPSESEMNAARQHLKAGDPLQPNNDMKFESYEV